MISLNTLPIPRLTPTRLILLVVAFLLLTGNWAFYEKLTDIYPWGEGNAIFVLSLTVFHYCFLLLITILFWFVMPARIVASLLLLLTAAVGYYADQLGVVIDTDMIRNVLQTNPAEMLDLINIGFVARFILLGIVPLVLVWKLPFHKSSFLRELRYKAQTAVAAAVVMVLSVVPWSDHYASFFREHQSVRYYMNPLSSIYAAGKYIKHEMIAAEVHTYTTLAERSERSAVDPHQELVVLVIGETARTDHFSLNGYERVTNPQLTGKARLISYSDISACGTSTAVSVPCMFGHDGRETFDHGLSDYTENILDLLKRAGVNILWRDNNSDSKGVALRVPYEDFKSPAVNSICDNECRDVGMLEGLQEYIDSQQGDTLIVLHQMGSHGPAYFKRYPAEFEQFKPTCKSIELSDCTNEEIVNAYDNTILYTDHFLSKVIELLQRNCEKFEATMFYVSDHGESLGEGGLYLHGMPYMFAPKEQTHVPLIVWSGDFSDIDHEKTLALKDQPNTHDALFGVLLELFEVETDLISVVENPLVYLKADH